MSSSASSAALAVVRGSHLRRMLSATRSSPQLRAQQVRPKTYHSNGAIKPQPKVVPFGIMAVVGSILPGLFLGAAVSKSVANFLEENDLFVPSDDDIDDD